MLPISDAQNMRACETGRIQAIIITFSCLEDHSTDQSFSLTYTLFYRRDILKWGGGYPAYGFSFQYLSHWNNKSCRGDRIQFDSVFLSFDLKFAIFCKIAVAFVFFRHKVVSFFILNVTF